MSGIDLAEGLANPEKLRKAVGYVESFTIPPSLQRAGCATKVTLCELSVKDELGASRKGGYDMVKGTYEATKSAIYMLDGKRVSNAEGDVDEFFEKIGPKVRALLVSAYEQMHGPNKTEETDFFLSRVQGAGD